MLPVTDGVDAARRCRRPAAAAPAHAASAELLEGLWNAARQGQAFEVRLSDGTALQPERFLRGASQQDYAMFVLREPDGTLTLTAVAWDTITRVVVGGLKELPPSLAE